MLLCARQLSSKSCSAPFCSLPRVGVSFQTHLALSVDRKDEPGSSGLRKLSSPSLSNLLRKQTNVDREHNSQPQSSVNCNNLEHPVKITFNRVAFTPKLNKFIIIKSVLKFTPLPQTTPFCFLKLDLRHKFFQVRERNAHARVWVHSAFKTIVKTIVKTMKTIVKTIKTIVKTMKTIVMTMKTIVNTI